VSIYVDDMKAEYGRMIMCHMIADTREELERMAVTIGVRIKWLQKAGTSEEHYDICLSKKKIAIKNGAKELTSREFVKIIQAKRRTFINSNKAIKP
jgi:hypothetical protein